MLPSSSAIPTFKLKGLWSSKWFRVCLVWFGLYRIREEIVETCGDPVAETSHLCLGNWSALGFTVQHFPRPPDYKNVHHDFQSFCTSYCVCCVARLGFLPSYSFLFLPSFLPYLTSWFFGRESYSVPGPGIFCILEMFSVTE